MKFNKSGILAGLGFAAVLGVAMFFHGAPAEQVSADVVESPAVVEAPSELGDGAPASVGSGAHDVNAGNAVFAPGELKVNLSPAPRDGSYDRGEFGKSWADVDGNGCDQRNDVLAASLENVVKEGNCKVMSGVLAADAYTGETIEFVRGEKACDKTGWNGMPLVYNGQPGGCSQAVTIDHVISLEEVWYLGAKDWSFAEREVFANDLDNLIATGANSWKNSMTPAQIASDVNSPMSSAGFCTYVKAYVKVAQKYDLSLMEADAAVLRNSLPTCA